MNEDLTKDTSSPIVEKRHSFREEVLETIRFVVIALIVVVPIRMFIAQPFIVSGASMDPTFATGQYLIVDEISYRVSEPSRGDVAIFLPPKSTRPQCLSLIYRITPFNTCGYYIKRIVGLPGETVIVNEQGQVFIKDATGNTTLTMDEPYVKFTRSDSVNQTLGEDEYFMIGDNRAGSSDSRSWGPVKRDFIIGRALVRLFPVTKADIFPGVHKQE